MKLCQIIISPGHDYWVSKGAPTQQHGASSPAEAFCEAGRGIVGDRYHDAKPNRKGQVTFMDAKVIDQIRERFEFPDLAATLFRRNLIVADADLSQLLGRRFNLQGVEFEGSQECRPCQWMDRIVAPGVKAFLNQNFGGGLRAKVITSGVLRVDI